MKRKNISKNNIKIIIDKRIAVEFAVGVVLLIAFIVGGVIWLMSARQSEIFDRETKQAQNVVSKNIIQTQKADDSEKVATETVQCAPHYYEGTAEIGVRFVSEEGDGIVVSMGKDDASKFPIKNYQLTENGEKFTAKLIDATEKEISAIKASTELKPATIDVRGYAEVCESLPQISLQPVKVAFKKKQ